MQRHAPAYVVDLAPRSMLCSRLCHPLVAGHLACAATMPSGLVAFVGFRSLVDFALTASIPIAVAR